MPRRTAASPRNSEWLTRRTIVDPKLAAAGWQVCGYDPRLPLASYDRCAIVEGKKLSLGPQNVLTQAERYYHGATSNPLSFSFYRAPFLYSPNLFISIPPVSCTVIHTPFLSTIVPLLERN